MKIKYHFVFLVFTYFAVFECMASGFVVIIGKTTDGWNIDIETSFPFFHLVTLRVGNSCEYSSSIAIFHPSVVFRFRYEQ